MPVTAGAWWSRLDSHTRAWLLAHNGELIPPPLVEDLERASGESAVSAWWAGVSGPVGVEPSDAVVDWIEAVANGEEPTGPRTVR